MLVLNQLPKCQFCNLEAKYEAISTNPSTIHNWVYVCEKDLSANAISDVGIGSGRLILLAE
jgi:hypothetical protein